MWLVAHPCAGFFITPDFLQRRYPYSICSTLKLPGHARDALHLFMHRCTHRTLIPVIPCLARYRGHVCREGIPAL